MCRGRGVGETDWSQPVWHLASYLNIRIRVGAILNARHRAPSIEQCSLESALSSFQCHGRLFCEGSITYPIPILARVYCNTMICRTRPETLKPRNRRVTNHPVPCTKATTKEKRKGGRLMLVVKRLRLDSPLGRAPPSGSIVLGLA